MTGPPPRRIGPYTLLRLIGSGGMGEVYLAQNPAGDQVAVKVLAPAYADDPEFRQRFSREVQAVLRVPPFCTAQVLDFDLETNPAYLVIEYVEGPDLRSHIHEHGPLRGSALTHLAVSVAVALKAIHSAGITHRDLKPANVLLGALGPKVIDFGIARLPDLATLTAGMVGTPAFMAPEQLHGDQVTPASDVFAWGGVVCYAATGKSPFGNSDVGLYHRVLHGDPDLAGIPEPLRSIVGRAMAKDPNDRPTAQQLIDALTGASAPGLPVLERETSSADTRASGRRRVLMLSFSTAALALALAFLLLRPPSFSGSTPSASPTGSTNSAAHSGETSSPPASGTLSAETSFRDDFASAAGGWIVGTSTRGRAEYRDGAYQLRPSPGYAMWHRAPTDLPTGASGVKIEAVLQITEGPGMAGVWCHGTPDGAADRYALYVSTSGNATIIKEGPTGPTPLTPDILASSYRGGAENRVTALCRVVAGGVELRLLVNGSQVAGVVDRQTPLPSGQAGLTGVTWGNQSKVADVRFIEFSLTSSPESPPTRPKVVWGG